MGLGKADPDAAIAGIPCRSDARALSGKALSVNELAETQAGSERPDNHQHDDYGRSNAGHFV